MVVVRITGLPAGTPTQSKKLAMDLSTAESATIKDIVYAGRPAASQAEAEAGTNAEKVMTAVATKQSIASQVGVTIASAAQGSLASTALQPASIGTTVASFAQGAKADSAMQPTIYDPLSVSGDAFDLFKMHGQLPTLQALGLQKNKPNPFNPDYIQNNVGLSGTFAVKLKVPGITGAVGFQGLTWVEAQSRFYSTWNRSNGDSTERQNIVRHDAAGEVLDYSATLSAGSANPSIDLDHGQDLDHVFLNGVLNLTTASSSGRGACIFTPSSTIANGWVPTNYRSFILQPVEVTSGTVALSTDKRFLIKTGGPYLGGKNIRIYELATLLAGADGDRQSDCIWEMMQPDLGGNPNQGLWMHDGIIYMLNGTQALAAETRITAIDVASKTILGNPVIVTTGKALAAAQKSGAGAKSEPEGCFVVRAQAGGPLQFWIGMGMDNAAGDGISSFALPVFQRDISASPSNGNRVPFDGGVFFGGGTHKGYHSRSEDMVWSYIETTVEGSVLRGYRNTKIDSDTLISDYVREADGVTQHKIWDLGRVTGKPTFANRLGTSGTWTPGIAFGGASVGLTYGTQAGRYVIGPDGKVDAWCRITLTAKGSSTGTAAITGLPATSFNLPNSRGNVAVSLYSNMASIAQGIIGLVGSNATTATLYTGGAASAAVLTDANFTATSDLILRISYEAA